MAKCDPIDCPPAGLLLVELGATSCGTLLRRSPVTAVRQSRISATQMQLATP